MKASAIVEHLNVYDRLGSKKHPVLMMYMQLLCTFVIFTYNYGSDFSLAGSFFLAILERLTVNALCCIGAWLSVRGWDYLEQITGGSF